MKNRIYRRTLRTLQLAAVAAAAVGIWQPAGVCAQEEPIVIGEEGQQDDAEDLQEQTEAEKRTGTWSVDSAWTQTKAEDAEERWTYRQSGMESVDATSTIVCSYLDTNYSVLEYEQLRDMLTNNVLYSNVDAQISTSAAYTDAKDYLYMVTVEPSEADYRDIYYYVVGDHRCFCVEVREYQAEADALTAAQQKTPAKVGEETAMKFTWSAM